jgi:hypothetical protein
VFQGRLSVGRVLRGGFPLFQACGETHFSYYTFFYIPPFVSFNTTISYIGMVDFVVCLTLNSSVMVPRPSARKRKRATKEDGEGSSHLDGRGTCDPMQQERGRQRVNAQRLGVPFFPFSCSIKTLK